MLYLLKSTFIWIVLLLLFEAFYKDSGKFTANRIYLILGLMIGGIVPFITLPTGYNSSHKITASLANNPAITKVERLQPMLEAHSAPVSILLLLKIIYLTGIAIFLLISFREIGIIVHHAIYSHYKTINGHKVFAAARKMAPYSFMGWIFISDETAYDDEELNYVLEHEEAHNQHRHWADLLLMQLLCILFWFHPLVWRYRYLLRLQHEYEADHIAAAGNAYSYGHFLLQQTLLRGTPFIAHSFHFSSIKNRINMLTKNTESQFISWKYLMVIPAMFGCSLLHASAGNGKVRNGNMATYKGNTIYWQDRTADTITIEDPITGKNSTIIEQRGPIVVKLNDEPVIDNKFAGNQAQFRNNNQDFSEYLTEKFKALSKETPDTIAQIQVTEMVINKQGKIVYYELQFANAKMTPGFSIYNFNEKLTPIIDKIIAESPNWLPATKDGLPINSYFKDPGGIILKDLFFITGKKEVPINILHCPADKELTPTKKATKTVIHANETITTEEVK